MARNYLYKNGEEIYSEENEGDEPPEVEFFLYNLRDGNIKSEKYRKIFINTMVDKVNLYDDCFKVSCKFDKNEESPLSGEKFSDIKDIRMEDVTLYQEKNDPRVKRGDHFFADKIQLYLSMKTDYYRVFLYVAETGNISKASSDLGYSQSGVSHIINRVEQELHQVLFSRSNEGVVPLATAAPPFDLMRTIVNAEDEMKNIAKRETNAILKSVPAFL